MSFIGAVDYGRREREINCVDENRFLKHLDFRIRIFMCSIVRAFDSDYRYHFHLSTINYTIVSLLNWKILL